MDTEGPRERRVDVKKIDLDITTATSTATKTTTTSSSTSTSKSTAATTQSSSTDGYGFWTQVGRLIGLILFFFTSAISIHLQQFLGLPLYWYDIYLYYKWQVVPKKYFALLLIFLNSWFNPTEIRISGDASIKGQIAMENGQIRLSFPARTVLISNHQIYTDWIFLWWTAYLSNMHGSIFIILKESLKYIPMLGPGMMFFSFIFLSRKWEADKPRLAHRLQRLKTRRGGPASALPDLAPMWLLIFPEGTTLCETGRVASKKWSEKTGIKDLEHVLLPRSRGLLFCLEELKDSVEWLYDCTLSYEGIPDGEYGQDFFTLNKIYLQEIGPPRIHMHWRRFAVKDMPLDDPEKFDAWLYQRYVEKDQMLEYWKNHGVFPFEVDEAISAKVVPKHPLEFLQIYISLLMLPLFWYLWKVISWGLSFL